MKRNIKNLEEQIKSHITNEELKEKLKKLKLKIKKKDSVKNYVLEPFYNSFVPFIIDQYKRYSDQPRKERYITDNKAEFMKKYINIISNNIMDDYNDKKIDKQSFITAMKTMLDIKKDFWVL